MPDTRGMNTFLPHPEFAEAVWVLDNKRLGKQRVECIQLLLALWYPERKHYTALWETLGYATCDPSRTKPPAYLNHPCTRMWAGYEVALLRYLGACLREWEQRGFENLRCDQFWGIVIEPLRGCRMPGWLGGPIHANHRGLLLGKDPVWYGQWGWAEKPVEKAWWPEKLLAQEPVAGKPPVS